MHARYILVVQALVGSSLAAYDALSQWQWVDQSCHSVIDRVNAAGEDYTALTSAALHSLGTNLQTNKLADETVTAYMSTHDSQGLMIQGMLGSCMSVPELI
jgi:hypothetical protein